MLTARHRSEPAWDRRWTVELKLTESEAALLREILEADLSALIHEIAKTDTRTMREGLRHREVLLKGILDRLGERALKAS